MKCQSFRSTAGAAAHALLIGAAIAMVTACGTGDDGSTPTAPTVTTSTQSPSTPEAPPTSLTTSAPVTSEQPATNAPVTTAPMQEQPAPPAAASENPTQHPAQSPPASGPQLGDKCIGAHIGKRAVDNQGNAIVCDNYMWRLDQGQEPRHPWVDEQRKWAECTETHTAEECRERLHQ